MIYLLIINFLLLFSLFKRARKFFPHLLYTIPLNLYSLGFYFICEQKGFPSFAWLNLLSPSWFVIGIHISNLWKLNLKRNRREAKINFQAVFNSLLITFAALSTYHFYKVGIPILSGSLETVRFTSLGSSGLFGLPGRVVLFATPALALTALVNRGKLSNKSVGYSIALFVVSNFFTGFKGALSEVFTVLVIGYFLSDRNILIKNKSKVLLGAAIAIVYVVWTAGLYVTFVTRTTFGLEYIFNRLTTIPATPQWVGLNILPQGFLTSGAFQNDFTYFLSKYFGIGPGTSFAFDQIVSSIIYNTPRKATSFIVPVTTGGTAYALASFSWWLVPIFVIVLGMLFHRVIQILSSGPSFLLSLILPYFFIMLSRFMGNGAGSYLFINLTVMALITACIYALVGFFTKKEFDHTP